MPRHSTLTLLGLFLLAAGLRLYRLDQGFRYDEIFSLAFFQAPWRELLTRMPIPNHHPLYSLLAKCCWMIWGEKEWALRLPAFAFGSLTPPLLYLVGSRWIGPRAGLLAGLFFSLALWPVWYSQDARGYSAMIFFSLLATDQFLFLAGQPSRGRASVYLLAATAAIYSHLYASAVIGGHLLSGLFLTAQKASRPTGWRLLLPATGALTLAGLLYAPMIPDFIAFLAGKGKQLSQAHPLSLRFIAGMFLSWPAGAWHPGWTWLVVVLSWVGLALVFTRRRILAGNWLLSLLIGLLIPAVLGTFVLDRFFAYALPGFFLFAAAGADFFLNRTGPGRWLGTLLLLATLTILASGLVNYYRFGKEALLPAAQWITQNAPGTRVLTVGMIGEVFQYYDPTAIRFGKGEKLTRAILHQTIVVIGYPSSVESWNWEVIATYCRPVAILPSGSGPGDEVSIYRCD